MTPVERPTEKVNLEIVKFCAVECELQRSGERSVGWMVGAWMWAMTCTWSPSPGDILNLGFMVEPVKNFNGFREVGVRVGDDVKGDWSLVPGRIRTLVDASNDIDPESWFYEYEDIHPFVDGNGRTGQILFNWLRGTLDKPVWAPNFWDDPRRKAGDGA